MGSVSGAPVVSVVVIDDHPLFIDSIRIGLERRGRFKVVDSAGSLDEAVRVIRANKPEIALVDVRLPAASEGMEVVREARPHSPATQFTMFTGSLDPAHVREALSLETAGYLSKDMRIDELESALAAIHAGNVVFSEPAFAVVTGQPPVTAPPVSSDHLELLRLAAEGLSVEEIRFQLAVSRSTMERRFIDLQKTLGVENRTQAVVAAVRNGWI